MNYAKEKPALLKQKIHTNKNKLAWNTIGESLFIEILPETVTYILNSTGADILQRIITKECTIKDIFQFMKNQYPKVPPNTILTDLLELIVQLRELGAVQFDQSAKTFNSVVYKGIKPQGVESIKSLTNYLSQISSEYIPLSVHIDLTYRCNLRCQHCYLEGTQQIGDELSNDEIYKVLEDLKTMGTMYVTLSGGEPFLRAKTLDLIIIAREMGFRVTTITNGTLLSRSALDLLLEKGVGCYISLYGSNAEIHDTITQVKGSYIATWKTIRYLHDRNGRLGIKTYVMRPNFDNFPKLLTKLEKLNINYEASSHLLPKMESSNDIEKVAIPLEQILSQYNTKVIKKLKFMKEGKQKNIYPCFAGRQQIYISPYGEVHPCVQFPLNCGNIRDSSIKYLWNENAGLKFLRMLTPDCFPCRSDCNLVCSFCMGLNYSTTGSIFIPYMNECSYAKLIHRYKEEDNTVRKGGDNL